MKVLITGAEGQLGTELKKVLDGHKVYGFGKEQLDITNPHAVYKCHEDIRPEVVIHCAAYTNVDGCEANEELAYTVNSKGAGNVAAGCLKVGAAMVYISTDYVFNGQKGQSYYEVDETSPINIYGKSKLAGERIVRSTLKRYYIVRTAWLYGRNGNNFVKTMLQLSQSRKIIEVVDDQVGSPTNAFNLAEAIKVLAESDKYGIYHVTNSGSCSWFEFAKKIFEFGGVDVEVRPITSDRINRSAKRPSYSVLNNFNLKANLGYEMKPWDRALKEYIQIIK